MSARSRAGGLLIEDGSRATVAGAWIFAGFWNLVSLPAAFLGVQQALHEQAYAGLFVLIFPVLGMGLLVWAVRATVRYRRFGTSRLELASIPASPGGVLRGTVFVPALLEAREGVPVTLTCLRRVRRGSGKNRSTSERVLWQEEQRATAVQARCADGVTTSIPVAFRLPREAEPSDRSNPRDQVIWRLRVWADVPGVDYASAFEVPVCRTTESETEAAQAAPSRPPAEPLVQPAISRVKVTRNRRGTEVVFPAARNPGVSAGLTAFAALWLTGVWATVHFGAPRFFQVIFGGVGLLIAWGTVSSWLGASRVSVGDGSVVLARGLLVPRRERRFPVADVAEITTRIGMQAGETPYYDLVLVRKNGRRVTAGRGIRDKREAEWLANTLREALNG